MATDYPPVIQPGFITDLLPLQRPLYVPGYLLALRVDAMATADDADFHKDFLKFELSG